MSKRTDYHRKYWQEHADKRKRQKRESNARVRARRRAAEQQTERPKLFERCLRCHKPLRHHAARVAGYGRVCALLLFGPRGDTSQVDWIGYSKKDMAARRRALEAAVHAPKRAAPVQPSEVIAMQQRGLSLCAAARELGISRSHAGRLARGRTSGHQQ